MGASVQSSLVSQVIQFLPGSILGVLDAWSHRVARRRARQRQQKWLQRKAAPTAEPAMQYHLKPWRD